MPRASENDVHQCLLKSRVLLRNNGQRRVGSARDRGSENI